MNKYYVTLFIALLHFITPVLGWSVVTDTYPSTEVSFLIAECPADTTIECGSSLDPLDTGVPTNLLGDANITHTDIITGTCPQTLTRTFTINYTDDQLVDETCVQTITLVDTTPPVVTVPIGNEDISCAQADVNTAQAYISGQLTQAEMNAYDLYLEGIFMDLNLIPSSVTDNCDTNLTWSHFLTYDFNVSCPQIAALYCHFYAVDNCGNVSDTVTTTAFVIDNVAPIFINPPTDITASCGEEISTPPTLTAVDDCNGGMGGIDSNPVVITYNETITPIGNCTFEIVRTWTATDYCGNTNTHVQTITSTDNEGPIFDPTTIENITISCGEPTSPGSALVPAAQAQDVCSDFVDLSYTDTMIPDNSTCGSFIRTWTALDECGNENMVTQTITIMDDTPPIITCPEDHDLTCNDDYTVPQIFATATDCSPTTITFDYGASSGDACTLNFERIWSATDACGNTSNCTQIISINDNTPPVFINTPNDTIIECGTEEPQLFVTILDDCDDSPTLVHTSTTGPGICPSDIIIYNTWVATDACGNQSTYTQTTKIDDTTPPFFTFVPDDTTIACDSDLPTTNAIAADSCGGASTLYFDEIVPSGICPNEYTINRLFIATDGCLNIVSAIQTITVVDTVAPIITNVTPVVSVQCDEEIPVAAPIATDNCGLSQINIQEDITNIECSKIITRVITAIDQCGNSSSVVQTINIVDTIPPVLSETPADIVLNCFDEVPAPPVITATDNCGGVITVNFIEEITNEGICPYEITRKWVAKDLCNNFVIDSMIISIENVVLNAQIIASPNPFNEQLKLDFSVVEEGDVTLVVYDSMGKLKETIFQGIAEAHVIYNMPVETSNWDRGMYIAILQYKDGSVKRQVVKLN